MTYQHERAAAIEAVLKACQLCGDVQHRLTADQKIAKSDASPVTIADFGSQAVIISSLLQQFPTDPVVGEEDARLLRQADHNLLKNQVIQEVRAIAPTLTAAAILDAIDYGAAACDFTKRYWTLDPIDGTKGFVRGDQYAVALALIDGGEVVLGVLGCPNLALDPATPDDKQGAIFIAVKNQGAFVRSLDYPLEKPIAASPVARPQDARFCDSVEVEHASHDDHLHVARLLGMSRASQRIDSQCKYAVVARGESEIYLRLTTQRNYRSWIWDHAAGVILVEEAGGKVSDMFGKPLDFSLGKTLENNAGIVATNGVFHEQVIAAIQQVIA